MGFLSGSKHPFRLIDAAARSQSHEFIVENLTRLARPTDSASKTPCSNLIQARSRPRTDFIPKSNGRNKSRYHSLTECDPCVNRLPLQKYLSKPAFGDSRNFHMPPTSARDFVSTITWFLMFYDILWQTRHAPTKCPPFMYTLIFELPQIQTLGFWPL